MPSNGKKSGSPWPTTGFRSSFSDMPAMGVPDDPARDKRPAFDSAGRALKVDDPANCASTRTRSGK